MNDRRKILDKLKNDRYSVNNNKSQELLFTFHVDPEENLKKLCKITALRSFDKGIKNFKIGLYLSAFEDKNSHLFFREAKKQFEKTDSFESEQFLQFLSTEKVNENIYLKGSSHSETNETFESFRKNKNLDQILFEFDTIRKEVLFNNYTSLKSILRIFKIIREETISKFKENLKKYKIGFNIIENSQRKEIMELKDSLKNKKKYKIAKKIRHFLKENKIDLFDKKEKINRSLIAAKKVDIEEDYQNVMNVVESYKQRPEKMTKLMRMTLIKTVEKFNKHLIDIAEVGKQFSIIEDLENTHYEQELAVYYIEVENRYEKKHEILKDEYKGLLNFRKIYFESIRRNQFASLFGKDFVKIFSTKEENYSENILWKSYVKMKICEQDYKDFVGIKNSFESIRKKMIRIENKTKRMFEYPEDIFQEIENIQYNVN